MAKLLLSKANLSKERNKLQSYLRFLPSLELKRQQLRNAQKKCANESKQLTENLTKLKQDVSQKFPMLADEKINLKNIAELKSVLLSSKNIVGCVVPELISLELDFHQPAVLGGPIWLFKIQEHLKNALELQALIEVKKAQYELLSVAVTKITQRVNLFEHVLIPNAQANIKKIQVHLGDREREAVVASKIAKRRHRLFEWNHR